MWQAACIFLPGQPIGREPWWTQCLLASSQNAAVCGSNRASPTCTHTMIEPPGYVKTNIIFTFTHEIGLTHIIVRARESAEQCSYTFHPSLWRLTRQFSGLHIIMQPMHGSLELWGSRGLLASHVFSWISPPIPHLHLLTTSTDTRSPELDKGMRR